LWQQAGLESTAFLSQKNPYAASISLIWLHSHQPQALHAAKSSNCRRLHQPYIVRELALNDPIALPQGAQEVPHANGNVFARDLSLEKACHGSRSFAQLITDARLWAIFKLGNCTAA